MTRTSRIALGVPAAIVALVALGAACSRTPAHVNLADLAAHQEAFNGRRVVTVGTVRRFSDVGGTYFLLEDAQHDRVEVRPAASVSAFEGRTVEVAGTYVFDPSQGRILRATSVKPQAGR